MEAQELATPRGQASFDFNVRAVQPTAPFWIAMYVASALGTNLGVYAQYFKLGLVASFVLTMIVSVMLIYADLKNGRKTEIFFWIAIVVFRAGATNVGDFITHNLHLSYALASFVLAAATLAAGAATRSAQGGASAMIDLRYWVAMFIAGVFGTIFGDLVAHAITFFAALSRSARLSPLLSTPAHVLLQPRSLAIGRSFLSSAPREPRLVIGSTLKHGLALGLPIASMITTALLLTALEFRRRAASH